MKTVVISGDFHIGSQTTDLALLKRVARENWRGHPVVLMGDLVDCGLDRGMEFGNKYNPQIQIDRVEEVVASLNVRAYVIGNHEHRIFKRTSLNPYKRIFGQVPKHDIEIGGRKIYINHGKSAADNPFLEHGKYLKWCKADLIALGHSHVLARMTVLKDGNLCHLVRTGSFLRGETYAVDAGFAPTIAGWVEYDTEENRVYLKAIHKDEVIDI